MYPVFDFLSCSWVVEYNATKFGITSINSDVWTLPDADTIKSLMSDPSQFIFVHASGFTAGFKTKEAAIEAALKLV